MTNAAFSVGLVVEGTDLQTDPVGYGLEVVRGLPGADGAEIEGGDEIALDGTVYARNVVRVGRMLAVEGPVIASSPSDYRDRGIALESLFWLNTFRTVVCLLENGDTATIEARAEAFRLERRNGTVGFCAVVMRAIVPDWTIT